jgi:alpha-mannosidase
LNTQPQKRFVDLSDGTFGLAVLNRGLPEYEVVPASAAGAEQTGSAVALTLLRSVEWLSRDDLATRRGHAGPPLHTPEAQGLGTHVFEYALVPHPGTWEAEDAFILQEAHAYEAPLRARAVEQHAGPLAPHWSFAHVTPGTVLISAIKHAEREDALVVRLVNPSSHPTEAELILAVPFRAVAQVNLAEERLDAAVTVQLARILNTGVRTHLRGGEIQTLLFHLEDDAQSSTIAR